MQTLEWSQLFNISIVNTYQYWRNVRSVPWNNNIPILASPPQVGGSGHVGMTVAQSKPLQPNTSLFTFPNLLLPPKSVSFNETYQSTISLLFHTCSLFYASLFTSTIKNRILSQTDKNDKIDNKNNDRNQIQIGSYLIPHDDKIDKGGEDAWFIANDGKTVGVFDGVGGWANEGVDPRDYSTTLSTQCKEAVDQRNITNPVEILRYGYEQSKHVIGSSTACITKIDGNSFYLANLGDSGFRIIRNHQIILASESQQHRFNAPFQLGTESDDTPELSDIKKCDLEDGDFVVIGTDGLFDNLYDENILDIIKSKNWNNNESGLAEAIAKKAYEVSKLPEVKIPFNDMAELYYGMTCWDNGKQDDITVLVVRYYSPKTRES